MHIHYPTDIDQPIDLEEVDDLFAKKYQGGLSLAHYCKIMMITTY